MNIGKPNILLVEDDSVQQLVAGIILRQRGMEVTIANNGAEAVNKIRAKTFQLILMDIQMPIMDGFEATTRIRAMEGHYFKTVPIVAFTSSNLSDVQPRAVEKGMTDFINKPLIVEEVISKIDKYVLASLRPLYINFNLYTDGDRNFEKELRTHLIGNINELQQSLSNIAQNASKAFLNVLHKVKSTTGMLCDREFSDTLEEVRAMSISGQEGDLFQKKVSQLSWLCNQVVNSLAAAGM